MLKVITVVGTRPEAIKLAPVIKELERRPQHFESIVCVTAQHREMLDQILTLWRIKPDVDLNIMRSGQSLTDVTVAVLAGLGPVFERERPDWVLVQGDTTTAMAASLSAFYHRVRVGHVEAGLRTWDNDSPYPEEVNRRVTAVIADHHFAPTEWAADNLRRESIPSSRISVTGNTVIDALRQAALFPFDPAASPLAALPQDGRKLVLVTAHRRENFGQGIRNICEALVTLADRHSDVQLVMPVHPNPQVCVPVREMLGQRPNVSLLPPLDYRPMVALLERCHFLITDSGGLQEEATGAGKPVLVLRDNTERPEGVLSGSARLVGPNTRELVLWGDRLLTEPATYAAMAQATNPYGDGDAAHHIVDVLAGGPTVVDLTEPAADVNADLDAELDQAGYIDLSR